MGGVHGVGWSLKIHKYVSEILVDRNIEYRTGVVYSTNRRVWEHDEDFKKSQVGIASTWSMVTPCNMHINSLAEEVGKGVDSAGAKSVIYNTITISDGISMGTEGMKYSLVSREVICDSIEAVSAGMGHDGIIAIGGCDKNMPGCLMGLARLNRPSIFVYGGTK